MKDYELKLIEKHGTENNPFLDDFDVLAMSLKFNNVETCITNIKKGEKMNVKITRVKPSERLIALVDKIETLRVDDYGVYVKYENVYIYSMENNRLCAGVNRNSLLNGYKLNDAKQEGIDYISQDTLCDLLEEHLYIEAHAKMEELLPQIQQYYPDAFIEICNKRIIIICGVLEKDVVIEYNFCDYEHYCYLHNGYHDYIWEDKDKLIVKEVNPFPKIKRGYKLTILYDDDNTKDYIVYDWSNYSVVRYCEKRKGFISWLFSHTHEEIIKIYNENDELIWEREEI